MKAPGANGAASRGCGRRRGAALLLLALSAALVACGQKGALYLPQKGKPVPAQSTGSEQRPATPQTPPSSQLPTQPPTAPESQAPAPSQVPPPGQVPQSPPLPPIPQPLEDEAPVQPPDGSGS